MTTPTLLSLARQRAERYRDKVAFDYCHYSAGGEEHRQLTFHDLDRKARAIASTLQRQGAAGERVLVLCPSGLDFIAAFFGCIYAGAAAVPVHPPVRNRVIGRVASIVNDVQARFALATAESQPELKAVLDDVTNGVTDGAALHWSAVDALTATAEDWVEPDVDPEAAALVQYTSGSTSSPKGVVVSHRNLLHNLEAISGTWDGDDNATAVFWLPLHHDMGLIGGILSALYVGASSFLMPPEAFIERPMRWLEALSRHRGTITAAPNFAYELCVEFSSAQERAALDLSNWSTAMCGAEPVRIATLERFTTAFQPSGFRPEAFKPVFGLAEATLLVSGSPEWAAPQVRHLDAAALREHRVTAVTADHRDAAPFVGCGRAQLGNEIVIVDPDTKRACAADQVGEIWVAGGSVAQGYWHKPAETQETFSAFLADTGRGPFLRTGDLGFQLDGELFVTGRLKDLVVIRGRNHYPEDLEATAQDSHPALLRGRGAAFSITPESAPGEELVVVQEVDRNRIRAADTGDVLAAIRTAVTEHHQVSPYAVVLLEPSRIPTTSSGKIRRSRCRQRFLDGELEALAQWRAPALDTGVPREAAGPRQEARGAGQIAAWFAARLAEELGLLPAEIDASVPFANYGLDSVRAIRLAAAAETWLGRELSPTLAYEYPTIDQLSQHLAAPPGDAAHGQQSGGGPAVDADEPIAIIGIGCRFPGADGPSAFWRLLCDGVDAVTETPPDRWNPPHPATASTRWGGFLDQVDRFDPQFFGISPREAVRMDPQQRLLLEVCWEALEDAGQVPQRLAGSRTGVFVGISTSDYGSLQESLQLARPDLVDAYVPTGSALSIAANRISYLFDLRGPSMAVDTACSSSLVAVHLACRGLRDGECTLAVAGGANVVLSPALGINFSKAGLMAADGRCKSFDARADGYVRGEGAGIVVLKPLSRALADGDPIHAVIRGSATNQDGRTNGMTAPSRQSQEAVLAEAYRHAGLSPGAVQYVEAHGSGTSLGDTIEANALGAVLARDRTPGSRCVIGSVKTNIGHLEAAAGIAGLIKVALALRHRAIPPNLHFTDPNPHIAFDALPLRVARSLTPWPENGGRAVAGVSSFGFGGANAHVVLTEAPQVRAAQPGDDDSGRVELLPLSARSPEALVALAARYESALAAGTPVADLCYTAGARRGHHDHRLAVVGGSTAELSESLAAYRQGIRAPGTASGHCRPDRQPGVVFVFSGQGSQWRAMGQRLYDEEPVFCAAVAECDRAMRPYLDGSVLAELLDDGRQSRLTDIGMIQPALFAVQVGLAALWRSWGVEPAAVVGHSLGEVAAAHVAGALGIDDAARVICGRARLLRRVNRRGAMLAAELCAAEAQQLVADRRDRVAVAADNSHRSTVLSGDRAALSEIAGTLTQRGRFCRWVEVDVASHGPQMDGLRGDLKATLAGLQAVPATIPMYSTVTGELLADAVPDDAYWVENLCSPVRFSAAARRLLDVGHDSFLEISPHPLLLSALREDADDLDRRCDLLASLRRDGGGRADLLTSLGTLYTRGQAVAWEQLHPWGGRCVAAPTYPWQRDRFWLDTTAASPPPSATAGRPAWSAPLRSSVDPGTVFTEIEVSTTLMPVLTDHRVHGTVVVAAATLLEWVSSAAARIFDTPLHLIADAVFHRSLTVGDEQQCTVQVVFRGEPPGPVSFECHSQYRTGPAQWTLLASGTVELGPPDAAGRPGPGPATIRSRCPDSVSGPSFYGLLAERGLQYGPGFQGVAQIWRRDGEAIARLSLPAQNRCSPGGAGFDAATLDACLQVLAATLPARDGHSAPDTYLPVGVTEFRHDGRCPHGSWCHAVLRTGTDPEPGTIEGDVLLLGEDGQTAIAVRGLRLQRIPDATPTTAAEVQDSLYELRWQPCALADPPPVWPGQPVGAGGWLIFSDGSAHSDLLREELERRYATCVLVEPGDDYARLAPDRYRLDPGQPHQFRRLLDEAFDPTRPPCRGVAHLWSLRAAPTSQTSAESLASARALGAASVLHLVQALTGSERPDPPRLWLVTQGAHAVGDDTGPVAIAQAPLWGMGRSIEHEHPELRCARVDLSPEAGPDELRALAAELCATSPEADVALRDRWRYVARLARYEQPPPAAPATGGPEFAFRMQYPAPGALDEIHALAVARRPPGPKEVEIRVHATGLNFIDAMRALGVYPGQDHGPVRVGIECAGTVTAVGDGVTGIEVGDAVIALAMDGVGSFVTTPACLVAAKPVQLSFQAAAALPIAFLTAYYALHEQARLGRGERILVHSGAGGVGLAAIEVAGWLGATIYATAGTPEKRDHLRALGVEHVFDSRSLAFAEEILTATDGQGVDVVLNSLTGEATAKGLATLGRYGRFVEIGKRDIYGQGRIRLWQLRHNASYLVVDLAQLIGDRADYVGSLLRDIVGHVEQGTLRPLPARTFPVADTAAAVRTLAQGTQIGKVVVTVDPQAPPAVRPARLPVTFEPEATYLITGGLGGIGRTVAAWLAEHGARHLVLMGRGPVSAAGQHALDTLRAQGVEVVVAGGDVTRADQLAAVLDSIAACMPPLRGVMHAAGMLDDGVIAQLDVRRLRDVMAPKVEGAWNVHTLTRDLELDFFVLFSSAASLLGSPGQAHYAAGNAFLDALAWHRHGLGLPALSIDWGPWAQVGLAAGPEQQRHLARHGVTPLPPVEGVRTLADLLVLPATQVAVLTVDWARWRDRPLLADLLPAAGGEPAAGGASPRDAGLADALRRADPTERHRLLESYLREQAAGRLGLAPSRLDIESPLNRLGVDSLIAVELRSQIERDVGIAVPVVQLLDSRSVASLARWLGERVLTGTSPPGPADSPAGQANGELTETDVAASRWVGLLAQLPDIPEDGVDELLREVLAAGAVQSEEVQSEEVQSEEVQSEEVQSGEVQSEEVPGRGHL